MAPAADAEDADALAVDVGLQSEEIDGGAEIFGIDVGRGDIARLTAAFAGVGRIERQGDETAFGHRLRIQAGRLFLHRAEGATHRDRRQLAAGVLRLVQVGRQRDAVAVLERYLPVLDPVALWEHLVPVLGQRHRLSS